MGNVKFKLGYLKNTADTKFASNYTTGWAVQLYLTVFDCTYIIKHMKNRCKQQQQYRNSTLSLTILNNAGLNRDIIWNETSVI